MGTSDSVSTGAEDADRGSTDPRRVSGGTSRREVVAAVVLAVVTILTAWSAFQATKWGGVMAIRFSEAAVARTTATQANETLDVKRAVDAGLFVEYVAARTAGEDDVAEAIANLFRAEFRPAFAEWQDSAGDGLGPDTPFDLESYRLPEQEVADEASAAADQSGEQAREARGIADNYVLLTVLSASVLFFAGVATKFRSERVQRAMLWIAGVLLVAAIALLVSYPIRV
jgi:hypothetical protein